METGESNHPTMNFNDPFPSLVNKTSYKFQFFFIRTTSPKSILSGSIL
jgi:hypothetical protein